MNKYRRYESPTRYEEPNHGKLLIIMIVIVCVVGYLGREQFAETFKRAFSHTSGTAYSVNSYDNVDSTYTVTPTSTPVIPIVEESKPIKTDTIVKVKKEKIVVKPDTTRVVKKDIDSNSFRLSNDATETPVIVEDTNTNNNVVVPNEQPDTNSTKDVVGEEKIEVKKRKFRLFKRR